MKLGIVVKSRRTDFAERFREILAWLAGRECSVVVESRVAEAFGLDGIEVAAQDDLPGQVDALVVFGGDGTLLSVARSIRGRKAPILGVNLGSLGFLTEVGLDELYPALESLIRGDCSLDRRRMLVIEVVRDGEPLCRHQALNDAVINKGTLARIFSMETFVDDEFVTRFLADGLIISTPTGSTAYSLSAGGPILSTRLEATVVTPICPHTLTNRPLVIPSESRIRVVVQSGEDVMLTLDGQVGIELEQGDQLLCTRSQDAIELVQAGGASFFDILRKKLKWGER